MKIVKKCVIVILVLSTNLLFLFISQMGANFYEPCSTRRGDNPLLDQGALAEDVTCVINNKQLVNCKRSALHSHEVYVPFSFLKKNYEIYGSWQDDRFIWSHSTANVYVLTSSDAPYRPTAGFMSFSRYRVELRARVKLMCATDGVPLSTQWSRHEYAYPTQIAQYGLSHYSRYVEAVDEIVRVRVVVVSRVILEDANTMKISRDSTNRIVYEAERNADVIEFNSGLLRYDKVNSVLMNLVMEVRLSNASSIEVSLLIKSIYSGKTRHFTLRYVFTTDASRATTVTDEVDPAGQTYVVVVGGGANGARSGAYTIAARDLNVDVIKAFRETSKALGQKLKKIVTVEKVLSIEIKGQGRIANITLKSSIDVEATLAAANWFLKNQDHKGGWSVPVDKFMVKKRINLKSGWYSAMSQGHAISLLVRAFYLTKKNVYLESAGRALDLFSVNVKDNGITTHFNDYVWYEEYPTSPSVFVLNGFIYALLGLYDASRVLELKQRSKALKLYKEGIKSLENLLPLFDTGSGSIYDLSHYSIKGVAPNLARMDYHATHVNQLYLLAHIKPDSHIFAAYAKRWHGYMKGERAAHN